MAHSRLGKVEDGVWDVLLCQKVKKCFKNDEDMSKGHGENFQWQKVGQFEHQNKMTHLLNIIWYDLN